MTIEVICRYCHSPMVKTRVRCCPVGLQIVRLLLLFVGMILFFFFPLGTVLGGALMIVSAPLSPKPTILWKCPNCGYFFPIA
jgi:hypothetical protein